MKTKEEIVLKHCDNYYPMEGYIDTETGYLYDCPLDKVYAAMEEYAIQRETALKLRYGIIKGDNDNLNTLQYVTDKLDNI